MPEADRELELLREGVEVLRRQGRVDEAVRLAERIRAIEAERESGADRPDDGSGSGDADGPET